LDEYLVVAKKVGFGFGFVPEQNIQRFYASLVYTGKFPIETDFPCFFPLFGVSYSKLLFFNHNNLRLMGSDMDHPLKMCLPNSL
jgi:hypothetical protein